MRTWSIHWLGWAPRWLVSLLILMALGCSHAISPNLRQQASPPIPFDQLHAAPEQYKARTVILGGTILTTENLAESTRIELLQKPLDRSERPKLTDATGGRFMALCKGYLDPAVYASQRRLTIAGEVLGSYQGKVGEADYAYPLISCEELHLWPKWLYRTYRGPYYAPYPWWYWHPYHHAYGWPYYW